MRYATLWDEVERSELHHDLKRSIGKRLKDPTYSEEYIKLLVQWVKVALYTKDEYDLKMLMYGAAPRLTKKQLKERDDRRANL